MVDPSRTLHSLFVRYCLLRFRSSYLPDCSGGSANIQRVAAHWVPDDKADTCMHCRSTKFSAYNRRHVGDRIDEYDDLVCFVFLALSKLWKYRL